MRAARLALLALTVAAACGPDASGPRWVSLARLPVDAPLPETLTRTHVLDAADWSRGAVRAGAREWRATVPPAALPRAAHVEQTRLVTDGVECRQFHGRARADAGGDVDRAPAFHLTRSGERDEVVLRLPRDAPPPDAAELTTVLRRGAVEGEGPDAVRRALAAGLAVDGLSVWPDEELEVTADVPAGSVLRLRTFARPFAATGPAARWTFRVELDGEPLFTTEQGPDVEAARHRVELPPEGRAGARFTFSVEGDPAVTLFAEPVVGPAEVGSYRERPWTRRGPDVVLFLADTFRADVLAAYGGEPGVTPFLDRLADEAFLLENARSPSVWTLPSHGSLFTGVLPLQHGATRRQDGLAASFTTLAEHLSAAGYRTAAVTDAGFVSRRFGMDQGFQTFREHARPDLVRNVDQALDLARADDGRPLFLFVHTYRTHTPYGRGPEQDTTAFVELMQRVRERMRAEGATGPPEEHLREFRDEYFALYLDTARALDAEVRRLHGALDELGVLTEGVFAFTSDHGEAFHEHGDVGHQGVPWEEKVRIPLFFHGPLVETRAVEVGASLIDVAPSIADLAGIEGDRSWVGRSVFRLDVERPLFTYNEDERSAYLAIVDGDRKLHTRTPVEEARGELVDPERLRGVFELGRDPAEARDLSRPDWAEGLLRRVDPVWGRLSVPLGEAVDTELDAGAADQLEELGYVE